MFGIISVAPMEPSWSKATTKAIAEYDGSVYLRIRNGRPCSI